MRKAAFYLSKRKGRILKTLAISMLVVMFLPNLQSFSQYLPSLVGYYAATQNSATAEPLSPGTIYDPALGNLETNGSIPYSSSCPGNPESVTSKFNGTSQLLQAISAWNVSLRIPSLLIMGQPTGSYIEQNYTIEASQGSASVTDGNGNSFQGFTYQINGLPASVLSSSLVGNSTLAIDNLTVSTTQIPRATISITYSIAYQYCEPSGLKVRFGGNLGQSVSTSSDQTFGIKFLGTPASVTSTRAIFQSNSDSASEIAFDWSDSLAQSPAFTSTSDTLAWQVGNSFVIDPEIVATSSVQQFGEYDHHLWYSENLWWLFYSGQHSCAGSSCYYSLNYSISYNGIQWATEGAFATYKESGGNQPQFDAAVEGSSVFYLEDNETSPLFAWRGGTLLSTGAIVWSGSESTETTNHPTSFVPPSVTIDNLGRVWMVIPEQTSTSGAEKCPCYSDVYLYSNQAMTSNHDFSDAGVSGSIDMSSSQILPLSNGAVSLVTCELCNGWIPGAISGEYIDAADTIGLGSSWGTRVLLTDSSTSEPEFFAADTIGNSVLVAYFNGESGSQGVYSSGLNYNSSTANQISSVVNTTDALGLTMTRDSSGNVAITVEDTSSKTLNLYKSTNFGSSWPLFEKLDWNVTFSYTYAVFETPFVGGNGLTGVAWEEGSSSFKNIVFASIPIVTPNPSVLSNSWSRPGGSPYETYFSHINDAISPGNGLLALEQDDLSLPGRNGMGLVISRVYESPFAFGPGNNTAGYDNYTLANVGLGWQLNFPWMGANYLHLADGQAYVYNWNTSGIFENHAGTDFIMSQNPNKSFDLYMAEGTHYHFYSNVSLAYGTDPTGNNTITFYYTSGHISSIGDSIGRTVSFTYNPSGELASVSSGGITYGYGYTGNGDLANVTDPLGRVTKYSYNGAIKYWLLTNVTYPTGGQLNFTYGKEMVGTEDSSYFVTLANVYTSSGVLDESNSYSYVASNGIISYTNETTADQTGKIQSYDIFQYPSGTGTLYLPITVTNSQSSPVLSGTQIPINMTWKNYGSYLAPNLQNVEFMDSNTVPIYAWCESSCYNSSSSSMVWLKLDQSVPAGQSITLYLGIGSLSTDNYGNGFWGECPTCSPFYGEYDNGAKVFSFYDNFAGNALSSSWTYWYQSGGSATATVNNGLTLTTTGTGSAGYYNSYQVPSLPYTIEGYLENGIYGVGAIGAVGPNTAGVAAELNTPQYWDIASWTKLGTFNSHTYGTATPYADKFYLVSLNLLGSSSSTLSANYSSTLVSGSYATTATNVMIYGYQSSATFDWVRTRILPPNNVMPTITFGSLETASISSPGTIIIPITISNSQASSVAAGTQVMGIIDWAAIPGLDSNLQNAEFFDSNSNPIYAWCESSCTSTSSSSTVWFKLNQPIPATGSISIYLRVGASSTNNLSPAGYWGENPKATSTYAQYDNGAKVFSFYNNFNGSTLSSSWTAYSGGGSPGVGYTMDNGITINQGQYWSGYVNSYVVPSGSDIDMLTRSENSRLSNIALGTIMGNSGSGDVFSFQYESGSDPWAVSGGTSSIVYAYSPSYVFNSSIVLSGYYSGGTNPVEYENYSSVLAPSMNGGTGSANLEFGTYGPTYSGTMFVQWIRARVAPPNNVMPSVALMASPQSHITLNGNQTLLRAQLTFSDALGRPVSTIEYGHVLGSAIAMDGSADKRQASTTSVSVSLSTTRSNDLIVVYALSANTGVTMSISDTDSLAWNTRTSELWTGYGYLYEFCATSSSILSSDSITVTQTKSDTLSVIGFAVSGVNTVSPFDPHSGLPPIATGSSTTPSVSISTSNANDMIIGLLGTTSNPTISTGSGYNLILKIDSGPSSASEYKTVSSAQSNLAVKYSLGTSENWIVIGDAIEGFSSSSSPGPYVLLYSTSSTYDAWGNMISSTSAVGQTVFYSYANTNSYDAFIGSNNAFTNSFYTNNTVVSQHTHDALVGEAYLQNGVGSPRMETYYDYDSVGEMLQQKQLYVNGSSNDWLYTHNQYDFYGNTISTTDPLGRTTSYQYSSSYDHAYLTNQSIVVSGKTISTKYSYNLATGWNLGTVNGNGQMTNYTYDNLGRETSITYPAVGGIRASTLYSYNDQSSIVTITDPNENVVKQYYDGLGRQIQVQIFNGTHAYSEEYYTYNYQNHVVNHTTPAGDKYSYLYDALGRQIEVINPDGTKSYTTNDVVLNSTYYVEEQTDSNGHAALYGYNWANELVWVQQSPQAGIAYTTKYAYDLSGNLLNTTDANNHITSYTYDNLNRLVMTKYPDGTNSTIAYDTVGNVIQTKDPIGNVITNYYDSLNRLVEVKYPNGATLNYTYDGDGNKLSMAQSSPAISSYYSYDARDRLANETDVISGVSYSTLYTYDNASNIVDITYPDTLVTKFAYDFMNRVVKAGPYANFTYTLDSKISTILYGNGVKTSYTYNSLDEAKSIYSFSGSTELMGLNYTYDNVGSVLKINNENYSYNNMNELATSSGPWGTTSYSYDGAGNMLNMTVGSTTTKYGYDSYNRMTSAGSVSLTYDKNGNLNKIVNGSTTWNYYYNYEDEMTSVTKNGATVQNNTYSGDGNREEQTVGSSSIVYTYQGSNVLFQKNLTSGIVTKNYYANGLLIGESIGSTRYYLLDDLLGSIRDLTTSTVSTVFSSNYKPFGESYGLTLSLPDTFYYYYTHKPYDSSTGLYYYGARYYLPSINRFTSEDTTKGTLSDPISLNRYAYAGNNPEGIVDPDGHGWGSWLTNALSGAANVITSGASAVATGLSSAATTASNEWNSLPPTDQALIVAGVVTAGVVAATVLTGGAAAPLAADAIATEAGDVAATEATSVVTTTIVQNTAGGAAGGMLSNAFSDFVGGKPITAQSLAEGALVGAMGGALSGGVNLGLPLSSSIGKFLLGQMGAGIATEITNVDVNGEFNHTPLPPLWEAIGWGATAGLLGAAAGPVFGPGGSGTVLGGLATGGATGFATGFFARYGTYLREPQLGPIQP